MKNRKLFWLFPFFVLFGKIADAQQDDMRMKTELSVKQGSGAVVSSSTAARCTELIIDGLKMEL